MVWPTTVIVCALLSCSWQGSQFVHTSITTNTRIMHVLPHHQAVGTFLLHYNLLGPLSYMQSAADQNVIMWPMTTYCLFITILFSVLILPLNYKTLDNLRSLILSFSYFQNDDNHISLFGNKSYLKLHAQSAWHSAWNILNSINCGSLYWLFLCPLVHTYSCVQSEKQC